MNMWSVRLLSYTPHILSNHSKPENKFIIERIIAMKNKLSKIYDWIIVGNCVDTFIGNAVTTLTTAFILALGNNVYQMMGVAVAILKIVMSRLMLKYEPVKKFGYKHFNQLMILECIIDVIVGIATLITKTAWIAVIINIITTPTTTMEKIGLNELTANAFPSPESRLDHDNKWSLIHPYITVVGGLVGFYINRTMDGATAFALIFLVDLLNNLCFIKQKHMIEKTHA